MNDQPLSVPNDPFANQLTTDDYQQVIGSFGQAVWQTDPAGHIVVDSPTWRAYTGQSLPQWLGEGWTGAIYPEDRAAALSQWQQALRTKTSLDTELRLVSPEGGWRWTNLRITAVLASDGSVRKWVGVAMNITDKKRSQEVHVQAEERFRAFVTATSDAVYQMSADWQQMHQLVGKSFLLDTTATSTSWLEQYIPLADQLSVQAAIDEAVKAQKPFELTHHVIRADGSLGWTFSRAIPILNQQGEITDWFGTASDITEQKRAEDAQRQSEAQYRTLFDSIDEGFCTIEIIFDEAGKALDYRFLEINPAFVRQTGLKDAIGRSMRELAPDHETFWFDTYGHVAQSGQAIRFEHESIALGRFYEVYAFPTGQPGQNRVALLFHDIFTRQRAGDAHRQNEARLQLALGIAQLGTWSWNLLTNEGYLDDRGAELIGLSPGYQANVAHAQRDSIHLDDLARTEAGVIAGIAQGVPFSLNYRVIHPDKSVHHIRSRFHVVADRTGRPVELLGTNRDVTAEYDLTTSLRQSQEKQAFLLSLSDALHPLTDLAGIEATAVRLLGEHLGASNVYYDETPGDGSVSQQGYGSHLLPRISQFHSVESGVTPLAAHPASQAQVVDNVATDPVNTPSERQVLQDAHIGAYITVPLIKQGHWVAMLAVHNIDTRPWTPQDVEFVQETAERTWAALERARVQEIIGEANRRKDEFLAMLAHELRNPMATVRNGLNILALLSESNPVAGQTVTMMNRQMDHLVRMVDDLLDVSRISRGKIDLKREQIELGALVAGSVDALRPQYDLRRKRIYLTPWSSALFVDGDTTRLIQVVTNLLTNGLRYSGEQGEVRVSLSADATEAVLRVADNGIGLASDQLSTIFELFVQVNHSLAGAQGGLGVGLTLAQRLVELHGGRIEAHSPGIGQGSEFVVYLPLHTESKKETIKDPARASATTHQRLLVIDDNADSALTLSMLLRLRGYEVSSRPGGLEGIQAAEEHRPNVILCDIGMPTMDGYETARTIRQRAWGKDIPLIALTGYGQQEDKLRAQEAGFDAHLVKPVDMDALLRLLVTMQDNSQSTQ